MKRSEQDRIFEGFGSSQEEVQELKKIASFIKDLPKAQPSSVFRAGLRERLADKAHSKVKTFSGKNKVFRLVDKGYEYGRRMLKASHLLAAAAAVFLIISLAVFYSQGKAGFVPPYVISTEKTPGTVVSEDHDLDGMETEKYAPIAEQEPEIKPSEGENSDTPEAEETVPDNTTNTTIPEENDAPEIDKPGEPKVEEEPTKDDPEFEAWKNRQNFVLAKGSINLPPVYYNAEHDAAVPADNIRYSWNPRKIVALTSPGKSGEFGTEAWAKENLSNNGFVVKKGDYLKIDLHETPKGLFAEVFYKPLKSADSAPTLVLHYQDEVGILSYYYEEKGAVGQPGFYPILSPAEAFKQVGNLEWYAPSQRLDFSFQEVSLVYHDFSLKESNGQKTVKLPSYRFLGRETLDKGGELIICLPAVK
ncbi:MAG: hypothetical protein GX996_02845 [Firmicutes bacterium]|nr:hypothetical protein [Bacillota bacterium]